MQYRWNNTNLKLPDENRLVKVLDKAGDEVLMRYYKTLWFVDGTDIYVYYTPDYWRYVE